MFCAKPNSASNLAEQNRAEQGLVETLIWNFHTKPEIFHNQSYPTYNNSILHYNKPSIHD